MFKLNWTKVPPTRPGKYAIRDDSGYEMIRVLRGGTWRVQNGQHESCLNGKLSCSTEYAFLEDMDEPVSAKPWPEIRRGVKDGVPWMAVNLGSGFSCWAHSSGHWYCDEFISSNWPDYELLFPHGGGISSSGVIGGCSR